MRTSIVACVALVALGSAGALVLDRYGVTGIKQFAGDQMARGLEAGRAAAGAVSQQFGSGAPARATTAAPPRSEARQAAVPVETTKARQATTSTDIEAVGSLQSDESVQISSEIAGRIAAIAFEEGQRVKAGDVLVKLDDALARAELGDAQARLELAAANFERAQSLARTGSTTQRAQDEATSALATARAAVELIQVRLDKLSIDAPFAGTVGIRKVSAGAYVTPGTPIANLEKIDELKADFKVPEIYLGQVKVGQPVEVAVDAFPGRSFPGAIYAIDPMLDVNGRALSIRARVRNPEMVLRPGLFARVTVKGGAEERVVVVPEEAIVPRGQDALVYRIEGGKAVETKVKLGARRGGEVEILEGLARDATVVTAGHTRLRNGASVEVVATAAAAQDAEGTL